ncbi:Protein of unknown function DUF3143 [Dillenia turbinata]|uniref:Uncharacterized protein n=1 Tax=Dillenia turbinata TaxID=194707 RepID=A0AAN8VVA8_9MAGN
MSSISISTIFRADTISSTFLSTPTFPHRFFTFCPRNFPKFPPCSHLSTRKTLFLSKSSETELSSTEDEWLERLPDKKKPLYSHSLPCVEAWLKNLGFYQSKDDRAVWFIEKPDWHAQLSLDVTDLYVRYLKSGPGKLEKDIERRFSYALSREDIENAILGGP